MLVRVLSVLMLSVLVLVRVLSVDPQEEAHDGALPLGGAELATERECERECGGV